MSQARTGIPSPRRHRATALVALLAATLGPGGPGCTRAPGLPGSLHQAAPAADSVTVSLWRFDEQSGVRCADSGPARNAATAGDGTRTGYGRFGGAREFTRVVDSFVYAPSDPALDVRDELTVEAWVNLRSFGRFEDTPIAARWTEEANRQSWIFGIVGRRIGPVPLQTPSPGYHDALVGNGAAGQLLFAFQPENASLPRSFLSTQRVPLDRWTHVAVSYDGQVVRFFIEGILDAQYAVHARIQSADAPLLIGNYIDPRRLTSFSGELRVDVGVDDQPYYAFDGFIDELRISNAARQSFPGSSGH